MRTAAPEPRRDLPSRKRRFLSISSVSVSLLPSPPPTREPFCSRVTKRSFPGVYSPFSYFLDGGHDPLDVIFGPAPGLRSDRPARHFRAAKIFLKLAGSSDTMQTVERTERPVRLRGSGGRRGGEAGCGCALSSDQILLSGGTKKPQPPPLCPPRSAPRAGTGCPPRQEHSCSVFTHSLVKKIAIKREKV